MAYHVLHGGPLAGMRLKTEEISQKELKSGFMQVKYGSGKVGVYVRDEKSAGGRDWDWKQGWTT